MINKKYIIAGVVSSCFVGCSATGGWDNQAILIQGEQAIAQYHETIRHSQNSINDGNIIGKSNFERAEDRAMVAETIRQRPDSKEAASETIRSWVDGINGAMGKIQGVMFKPASTPKPKQQDK